MQHIYNDMPKNGRYGRVTIYRDKYRSCLDSKDLNGKFDDMYCVEVNGRMSSLDEGPG